MTSVKIRTCVACVAAAVGFVAVMYGVTNRTASAQSRSYVPVLSDVQEQVADVARGLRAIDAMFKPVAEKVHKWHHSNRDTKSNRLDCDCGNPGHEPKLTGLEPLSPAQRRAIAAAR